MSDVARLLLDVNQRIRDRRRRAWPLAEETPTTFLVGAELAAVANEVDGERLLGAGNLADGVRLLLRAGATRSAVDMLRRSKLSEGRA